MGRPTDGMPITKWYRGADSDLFVRNQMDGELVYRSFKLPRYFPTPIWMIIYSTRCPIFTLVCLLCLPIFQAWMFNHHIPFFLDLQADVITVVVLCVSNMRTVNGLRAQLARITLPGPLSGHHSCLAVQSCTQHWCRIVLFGVLLMFRMVPCIHEFCRKGFTPMWTWFKPPL